ncbi:MAG: LPS export ABC transporter permease LptG [Pseudomonadota bacterium]
MRVLGGYVRREVYLATALVVAALLGLFALFDLIGELDGLGEGGYRLREVLVYVALNLPGHLYQSLPVAVLIGTTFALTQLAQHSEFTVIRASGVPVWRIGIMLLRAGVVMAALGMFVGEVVAPAAERTAQSLRLQARSAVVAQEFRSGLWVKEGSRFVNVTQVTPEPRLLGMRVYEFDDRWALQRLWSAAEGVYEGDGVWALRDVVETRFTREGTVVEREVRRRWNSVIDPELLSVLLVRPDEMSATRLHQYIRHLRDNRLAAQRYEVAFWRKLLYPLGVLVMVLLALPFAHQPRRASAGPRVFAGIMLGLAFYFTSTLMAHLGVLYDWAPVLPAVVAPALFLAMALALERWFERR